MTADSTNTRKGLRAFNWRILAITEEIWKDKFPINDDYDFSIWPIWESRIKEGHQREEQLATDTVKRMKDRLTPEEKESVPDDMFDDAVWPTVKVTNVMYACLVVSLWACVEGYLKDLLSVCKSARHPNKRCSVHSFDITKIKNRFKKEVNIKLEKQPSYPVVNAVRILCNSFKHSEGFYEPEEGKPHSQIAPDLMKKWNLISNRFKDRQAIDYDVLPIQELVFTCGTFFEGLLEQIKKKLEGPRYSE